jgi:hypothetical protein
MTHPDYPLGIDCEEMLVEEYDSNESTVIYNSDDDFDLSDSELSNDFELDSVVEDIFDTEEYFLDEDKINGSYYIGLPCLMKSPREWILQISVQPKTMLSNRFTDIMRYLVDYSVTRIRNPRMHIMKLDVSNTGAYNVILKTFWLKLIQRTWKRVFKERQDYIKRCKNPNSLLYRDTSGYWENRKAFPGLIGMLYKN